MSSNIEYKKYVELQSDILDEIISLEEQVFPKALSKEKIRNELSTKSNLSIFIAYDKNRAIAYKVGFERSKRIYYSWIGGVIPEYRKKGVAKELMTLQHNFAKETGYRVACTQADNSFKSMIILNLKSGFEIRGTIQSTGDDHQTIVMEKSLS